MTPVELSDSTPAQPVEAVCCDRYYADLRDQYAFIFQVIDTGTRFTVYTSDGERFQVSQTYRMLLTRPDTVTLPMTVEEAEFLRTCLHNASHRWREAITEADAGAVRPPRTGTNTTPGTDTIDVEPTPAEYHTAAQWFRDELAKVEHLIVLVETQLRQTTHPRQPEVSRWSSPPTSASPTTATWHRWTGRSTHPNPTSQAARCCT
jgi:hypothetical protein